MSTPRRRAPLAGVLALMLLAGLLALTTPVFAGNTGTNGSGRTAKLSLAINPSRGRTPAAPTGGAVSATPLQLGSGRASRPGSTAFLAVVLAIPGRPRPSAPPARHRSAASPTTTSTATTGTTTTSATTTPSGTTTTTTSAGPPARATTVAVTATRLRAIAASAKHPIYWAGKATATYELTTVAGGPTYLRYLPPGVPVGSPHHYLTLATYTRTSSPYEATRQAALANHSVIRTLKGGGLAIQYTSTPHNVYLVFPRSRYEVHVYDPSGNKALSLATTGKIVRIS